MPTDPKAALVDVLRLARYKAKNDNGETPPVTVNDIHDIVEKIVALTFANNPWTQHPGRAILACLREAEKS